MRIAARLGVQIELVTKTLREHHPLAREAVDVRRLIDLRAIRADRVRGMVVRHDEDDVRTIGGRDGDDAEHPGDGREQEFQHGRILVQASRLDDVNSQLPTPNPKGDTSKNGVEGVNEPGGSPFTRLSERLSLGVGGWELVVDTDANRKSSPSVQLRASYPVGRPS